jgi:hypothetical protein
MKAEKVVGSHDSGVNSRKRLVLVAAASWPITSPAIAPIMNPSAAERPRSTAPAARGSNPL